jgi:uncharacterized protein with GYD domain
VDAHLPDDWLEIRSVCITTDCVPVKQYAPVGTSAIGEEAMTKYLVLFSYTDGAVANMLEHPSDRAVAVTKLCEAAGGRLESFHWMLGPYDGALIAEVPDAKAMASIAMAVGEAYGAEWKPSTIEINRGAQRAVGPGCYRADLTATASLVAVAGRRHMID